MDEQEKNAQQEIETPVFQLLHDLSEQEKEEILSLFTNRLKVAEGFMKTLYPSMIANYKKYCSVADPIKDEEGNVMDDRANLFIPYPFAVVENEMPRLAGRLPRARAFPRNKNDRAKVDAIQDLIYYALDRMNFIGVQTLWLRQYAIYGWSPLYYYWRLEEGNVLERVPTPLVDGTVAYPLRRTRKKKFDDFWATVLDVFDCFIQPGVREIEGGDYFMFREWFSAKDLRKMVKAGILYPEVEKYLDANESPDFRLSEGDGRRERDEIKGLVPSSSEHTYGKYELMWMLENERVVQVLDRNIVARVGDNPNPLQEIPIINCNLIPLVNEPIGVGSIEALAGLPDKLNALTNARLDNISLLLNQVFVADRNDQYTDFKNVRMSPGNVILSGNPEHSIVPLKVPDLTQSSEIEVRNTKEDIQFVSSVSDFMTGTKTGAKLVDTATGVSTVVREGNARFSLKLSAFESGSLRKFIEVCHAYNMTYMPEEKRIHVAGPKGIELRDITIDDILCECDFVVEPGSCVPLDQLSRREFLINLLDRVLQVPMIVRVDEYMREVLQSGDIRNVDDLMVKQDGIESAAEDVRFAEAENTALAQGMNIALVGNDGLHLGIHQSADIQNWSDAGKQKLAEHVEQHQLRVQQLIQQQMGGLNGSPDNPAGIGAAVGAAGGMPGMAGPAGLPEAA